MSLPQLPQDKANHALYCAVIFTLTALVLRWLGAPVPAAAYMAVTVVVLVGAWKEVVHDRVQRKGNPSWADMAANVGGLAIAAASFAAGAWRP